MARTFVPRQLDNRLTQINKNGAVSGTYVYDGDGVRVKETAGGVTRVFIGAYFEWTGSTTTMKRYYYAGGTRVAMRTGSSTLNYLLNDHLGSQALTLDQYGARLNPNTELRYMPYGAARYTSGTTPTTFNFTGQRKDSGSGLLFYNARWYDPQVGRFLQADTIVPSPGNPQSLNRYAYVLNNPLNRVDPSGHLPIIPPVQFPLLEFLTSPYVRPLWLNPLVGAPVILGLYREAKGDAPEALSLMYLSNEKGTI